MLLLPPYLSSWAVACMTSSVLTKEWNRKKKKERKKRRETTERQGDKETRRQRQGDKETRSMRIREHLKILNVCM
jgi:hypothetical protein